MILDGLKKRVKAQLKDLQKPENVKKFSIILAAHLNKCEACGKRFERNNKKLDWVIVKCVLREDLKGVKK